MIQKSHDDRMLWAQFDALEMGTGWEDTDILKPQIMIESVYGDSHPGSCHLNQMVEQAVYGVYQCGGKPAKYYATDICDGCAQGHDGMNVVLASREAIANMVEVHASAVPWDGMILSSSCDKSIPAHLKAAARMDIPAIFMPGGSMRPGPNMTTSLVAGDISLRQKRKDAITPQEVRDYKLTGCPSVGACTFLGTASTMQCMAEALGLTLPGAALVPATMRDLLQYSRYAGRKIMELVEKNITARQIITDGSIRNAIKACLAMSGSTNAVMHLTAIAYEAELGIKVLDEFDSLSDTTPQLARMNPSCKYSIVDFYKDGGVPRLMENLRSMLETDVMTVTAHTLAENIDSHKYLYPATGLVNHTLDDPFGYTGGVAVLRGNLAPDTGITKPGAFDKSLHHFKGEAICFDSEEAAEEAILAGKIHDGHVVVIRYEGPKGGPGMREMFKAMKYLYGRGLAKTTALITDGRFSGTNNGCFVGHISPEAAEGGPIAIVHDGDTIEIDVDNKQLNLLVPDEEIEARLKQWKRPEPKFKKGWLGLYCKLAASGSEGGVMKFDHL